MPNPLRVNVTRKITANQVQRDTSKSLITIKDVVPIIDEVVMNGGLYPAVGINAGYTTLEDTPAPLHHPQDENGNFISARSGKALMANWIGACNEKVRKEGDKVLMDIVVNVDQCKAMEGGRDFLKKLDEMENGGDPIHVSTGLLLNRKEQAGINAKGVKYNWIAEDMVFDHVAILLKEPGAATPEDGVGIFANAAGDKVPVMVVNIDAIDQKEAPKEIEIDGDLLEFVPNASKQSFSDRLTRFIKSALSINSDYNQGSGIPKSAQTNSQKGDPLKDMMKKKLKNMGYKENMDDMDDEAMMNAYEKMMKENMGAKNEEDDDKEAMEKMKKEKAMKGNSDESIVAAIAAAMAPVTAELASIKSGIAANSDKEKAVLVANAVESVEWLTEEVAKTMPTEALQAAINASGTAFGVNGYKAPAAKDGGCSVLTMPNSGAK